MTDNSKKQTLLPIWLALALGAGIVIGAQFVEKPIQTRSAGLAIEKMREVLLSIDNNYVDSVDVEYLVEEGIKGMLDKLDPHTSYIPGKELNRVNAGLRGSYDGIGIEFDVISDSITVVKPTLGGPSDLAGIQIGDRIIMVNGEPVVGISIDAKGVTTRLLGDRGSEVEVEIYRPFERKKLTFNIKRGSIKQSTVDAFYMVDNTTGYIKLSRFGSTSHKEIINAIKELTNRGMSRLVLDLQGNPGGYLNAAEKIADEFIKENMVIVSQKGKQGKYNDEFIATSAGLFEDQPVIILVDENSASASEIVAGALQDNDRALIVGRRSFGKGLVQMPIPLTDGSELRLTIARYYTPSGRSIQKSYKDGNVEYAHDINNRYSNGEFYSADSIHFEDSAVFETTGGRAMFGGGGVMPDHFVPLDTIQFGSLYRDLLTKKVLRTFAINYYLTNQDKLHASTVDAYTHDFVWGSDNIKSLKNICKSFGVDFDEESYELSSEWIQSYCKAEIARLVWGGNAYYQLINPLTNKPLESSLQYFEEAVALNGSN